MKQFLSAMLFAALLLSSFALSGCDNTGADTTAGGTSTEPAQTDAENTAGETDKETAADTTTGADAQKFTYDRVVILGVDGAGAFFKQADTPNIDEIFKDGATSYDVLTSDPTISAECWGSMLTGVTPDFHRLSNSVVVNTPYNTESKFPTLFRVVHEAEPNATLASFCDWNPINIGIIEDGIGVHKDTAGDAELTEKICSYVAKHDPKVLFVQFDEVDAAGHSNGYGTKNHLAQITTTDTYIGKIYNAYKERGLLDTTLFIVTADHGGTPEGSHGGLSDAEKYVFYGAVGKTVAKGQIGDMAIRDNAAIVLYALGISQPKTWTARVPSGLFEGVTASERPVYTMEYDVAHRTHKSVPTPAADSGKYITDVLGADSIIAYLPFDGDTSVAFGTLTSEGSGKLYYPDGYFGSGIKLDDGNVKLDGFKPGSGSFAVSFWIKTGGTANDPCVCSNKDWSYGVHSGFVLSLRQTDIKFNLGDESTRMDVECPLPADYVDGWMQVVLSVDREGNKVDIYIDYKLVASEPLTQELSSCSIDALELYIGQDGTGKYVYSLPAELDEFVVCSRALTQQDVSALESYYGQ